MRVGRMRYLERKVSGSQNGGGDSVNVSIGTRDVAWSHCLRLASLLLAALALLSLGAAPALAEVKPFEVSEYVKDFDVSRSEAVETLETQDRGTEAGIVAGLERRLGSRYAGVWYDNQRSEFVVPLLDGEGRKGVNADLAAAGLGSDYRAPSVDSSWAELEAAQKRINRELSSTMVEGYVQTSIDPRVNKVVIHQAAGIDPAGAAKVLARARAADVAVEVRVENTPKFQMVPASCGMGFGLSFNCDAPLRGGVNIGPAGTSASCTAGFKATGIATGNRYVLSAGHCAMDPFVSAWDAYDHNGTQKYLGPTEKAYWGTGGHDLLKIRANNSKYWDTSPWPTQVIEWNGETLTMTNSERPITSEASSYVGEFACLTGGLSGTSCGYVKEMHWSLSGVSQGRAFTVNNLSKLYPVCNAVGNSGGPVFSGNTALGLTSFVDGGLPECANVDAYTEITEDTDYLGVTVAPRISPPPAAKAPIVQTNPATSIQEGQATLNGTVNPNGSETTYRFEYGKTTSYGKSIPVPNAGAGAGTSAVPAYLTPTLEPRTRYHYRLVASNVGGTSYGSDQAFTTGVRWYLRNSNSSGPQDAAFWFGLPGEKKVTGDWDGNGTVTPGSFDPVTGMWKLRNSNTTGTADVTFQYGGGIWSTPISGDWDGNGTTTIGVYDPSSGVWHLRNTNGSGNADLDFQYGGSQFTTVTGDWNGDGTTTIGLYEPTAGTWKLRNSNSAGKVDVEVQYGGSQFRPVTGDWNNDKTTTIGLFEPTAGTWKLRNSNSPGSPNVEFQYGGSQFVPLTGDWDGNGTDTPVLANPTAETVIEWRLRNSNSAGNADLAFEFGAYGAKEVVGDWDGNGTTTTGTYDPVTSTWKLRNSNTSGSAEIEFNFGGSIWTDPVVGDWDGNGTTTIGVYDPVTGNWRLKNSNSAGNADMEFQYGGSIWTDPVVGDWDANKTTTIGVYDPVSGTWHLRNSNTAGSPNLDFQWGGSIWTNAVTGDWNNDKTTTIGVYDPNSGTWRLKNSNSGGNSDYEFAYGGGEVWNPLSGDWNGDGTDTVAVATGG